MTIAIRPMHPDDSPSVAPLLEQLGYPADPGKVTARLQALRQWPDQEVFVAQSDEWVVGLCQVQGVRLLASDGYAEIQALVVASEGRRQGLGSRLVTHAIEWAKARGYARVRLRSGVHREGAHRFYLALGFKESRASYAFEIAQGGFGRCA